MHGKLPKTDLETKTKRRRGRRALAWLIVLAAVAGALYYVYYGMPAAHQQPHGRRFAGAGNAPVPVLIARAKRADVPVYLDAVGTVQAQNTVTVRPQVDGKLLSVTFKEGQDVNKDDVLARIDPTIYQAQLDQAKAKKAQDEAQLANARVDLVRYQRLAAANAINKQQADTQKALVAQYTALVQADQAAIENAAATLGYTTITAPISGRTGIRMVDAGNYVRASDSNSALVTITQIKPIAVLFNLPQQDLERVNAAFLKGPLTVQALSPATGAVIETGKLTVVDNQVDPSTGTVKMKAEFANGELQLWPGQFVNVRLLVDTLKGVVVIPTSAVQRGPNGTFVYVVDAQDKALMTPIKVQRQDESQAVVASGVTPPQRVVTTGFVQLTDGKTVSIGSNAPGASAAPPQGRRPHGQRSGSGRRHNGVSPESDSETGNATGAQTGEQRVRAGSGTSGPRP
ncbi:MAG TPA: efflux RND transporter periplasmic adaptor subunit [Pseudolabrys sp.]|nr:efflux RND transporter periplasmic adaptor subunit [Pseudolabrys sp.]